MNNIADDCDKALKLVRFNHLKNTSIDTRDAHNYINEIIENAFNGGKNASRCLMKKNLILIAFSNINSTICNCMKSKQTEFEEKHLYPIYEVKNIKIIF